MGETTIYLMDIREAEKTPEAFCMEHFPKRYEKAMRFRFREDQLRCLTAGILLYNILRPEEADIRYNEFGKPFLESGPCFSLSHSGSYAVLAVSPMEIGVDLEQTKENSLRVMSHVFTDDEVRYVGQDAQRFYTLWTLKESLSKAAGTGLSKPMKEMPVLPFLKSDPVFYLGRNWYGSTRPVDEGKYILSAVSGFREQPEVIMIPQFDPRS